MTPLEPPAPVDPPLRRAVEVLGGGRGALLASLPTVGYVVGDGLGGLRAGAVAGIAAGLVVLLERLRARARVTPAVAGFVGVVALVALALSSGTPTAFFVPAVLTLLGESALVTCAALAGRPVTGLVARQLHEVPTSWRSHPRLRQLFVTQDLVWAVLLALRAAITAAFVITGSVAGAGLFRLTGTPMYVALIAVCVRWARPVVRGDAVQTVGAAAESK